VPKASLAALLTLLLCSCGRSDPSAPTPLAMQSSPEASPEASPEPSPEPSPTAPPAENRPPTVSVSAGGSCYARPSRSCQVDVDAEASDPDGDTLEYEWSGCASGSGRHATCVVDSPGRHVATVRVRDGHGGSASASGASQGTNAPPTVSFGLLAPTPVPSNSGSDFLGDAHDPDEGLICGTSVCVEGRASGPCTFSRLKCTCLAGIDGNVRTTTGPGTCRVTLVVQDEWGLRGSGSISFAVSGP